MSLPFNAMKKIGSSISVIQAGHADSSTSPEEPSQRRQDAFK